MSILYLVTSMFAVMGLLVLHIRLRYSLVLLVAIGLNLLLLALSFGLHRGEWGNGPNEQSKPSESDQASESQQDSA